MKRFSYIILCVLPVFVLNACKDYIPDITSPNIVIIFCDDMGYGDIGSYGATGYETPNLDRLAVNGLRFTDFLSAHGACSASRTALLTGCYANRLNMPQVFGPGSQTGINADEMTIAELLKQKGYATAVFGKWHLGDLEPFLPLQHGFDEYLGIPYSNDMWPVDYDGGPITENSVRPGKAGYPPLPLIEGNELIEYLEGLDDQDRLTTRYTERAVSFIGKHRDEPFFLYLPHSMPHVPLGVSDKFRGKSEQGLYGDVIMEIDWSLGEIVRALDENDLLENTLLIFTSDNGPWLNYGNHAGSTGGLKEGKGTSMEGGVREPCIMHWPAVITPGQLSNSLASTIDILPTIAEITGTQLPGHKIDGVSILPILRGDKDAKPRETFYYYYHSNNLEAVRMGQWKLVFPHDHRSYENVLPGNDGFPGPYSQGRAEYALYNLRRDPGERYDVKEQHPDILAEMEKLAEKAREDIGDNLTGREGKNRRQPGRTRD
ncbi:MAG: sulfatase [Bacteroidales bacterium]|jgi:arylsulfatase|nr:sulfatase [Bacteroidales bacterium]